jgi:hypothetical protein
MSESEESYEDSSEGGYFIEIPLTDFKAGETVQTYVDRQIEAGNYKKLEG